MKKELSPAATAAIIVVFAVVTIGLGWYMLNRDSMQVITARGGIARPSGAGIHARRPGG